MLKSIQYLLFLAGICSAMGLHMEAAVAGEEGHAEEHGQDPVYYVEDVKETMIRHIENTIDKDGIFTMLDAKTGEMLALKFVQIHDPVRQIGTDIYFACTDFHVVGQPDKLYDLDFWMNDKTGELKVYDTKVHKEPRSSMLYGWYKHPRYTFVNDQVEYLY